MTVHWWLVGGEIYGFLPLLFPQFCFLYCISSVWGVDSGLSQCYTFFLHLSFMTQDDGPLVSPLRSSSHACPADIVGHPEHHTSRPFLDHRHHPLLAITACFHALLVMSCLAWLTSSSHSAYPAYLITTAFDHRSAAP